MSKQVKLTRIESNHQNMRTNSLTGELLAPLKVGEAILIQASPADWINGPRCIITSSVLRIEGNRYHTANSIYEIEFLE